MNNISLRILEALERNGEMKLCEISKLINRKHNDHRDFYPVASLITKGLIEDSLLEEGSMSRNPDYKSLKIQLLAWKLFATSNAEEKAEYKGRTWMIRGQGEFLKDQLYFLTGYGYLYLEETRSKEQQKRFTLLVAVFSGVLASSLTYCFAKFI